MKAQRTVSWLPTHRRSVQLVADLRHDAATTYDEHARITTVSRLAVTVAVSVLLAILATTIGAAQVQAQPHTDPKPSAKPSATTISGYMTYNPLDPSQPEIFDPATGLTIVPDPSVCRPIANNQFPVSEATTTTDGWAQGERDAVESGIEFYVVWSCTPAFADEAN